MSKPDPAEDACLVRRLGENLFCYASPGCKNYHAPWPPAPWWEVAELVLNDCPELPLKAFRKSMIGRGKPLTAKQADSAIRGAQGVLATGKFINSKARVRKREIVPESMDAKLARMAWYIRIGLPLVVARPLGYRLTEDESRAMFVANELEAVITILRWDDDNVHRLGFYE